MSSSKLPRVEREGENKGTKEKMTLTNHIRRPRVEIEDSSSNKAKGIEMFSSHSKRPRTPRVEWQDCSSSKPKNKGKEIFTSHNKQPQVEREESVTSKDKEEGKAKKIFTGPANSLAALKLRKCVPTEFMDTAFMKECGIYDAVVEGFGKIGWQNFVTMKEDTYPDLVHDFLSSMRIADGVDEPRLQFDLRNHHYDVSMDDLRKWFGWKKGGIEGPSHEELVNFWPQFCARVDICKMWNHNFKAKYIRHGWWFYVFKVMARSFYGRDYRDKVTWQDYRFLYCLAKGIQVDFSALFLKRMGEVSLQSEATIYCGGFITYIAKRCKLSKNKYPTDVLGATVLNGSILANMRCTRILTDGTVSWFPDRGDIPDLLQEEPEQEQSNGQPQVRDELSLLDFLQPEPEQEQEQEQPRIQPPVRDELYIGLDTLNANIVQPQCRDELSARLDTLNANIVQLRMDFEEARTSKALRMSLLEKDRVSDHGAICIEDGPDSLQPEAEQEQPHILPQVSHELSLRMDTLHAHYVQLRSDFEEARTSQALRMAQLEEELYRYLRRQAPDYHPLYPAP